MDATAPDELAITRDSWHRVAEHVLAAGQNADAGSIRLRPYPGGIATERPVAGHRIAVVGGDLVLLAEDGSRRSTPLTTLRAAAAFAGVLPGLRGSYPPATPLDLDAPLPVDPAAARRLADWYALGDAALRRFAEEHGEDVEPVLWPEHFDVGITLGPVNYGCSPGDDSIGVPYLYVGPHAGPPAQDDFWNAPFGAGVTEERIASVEDALTFFQHGRSLLEGSRT